MLGSKKVLLKNRKKQMPDMNSRNNLSLWKKHFFFENFVITVISFGKMAENFFSPEKHLSSYGLDFILEPLQNANYVLECGTYDEMIDFRHFFPCLMRHISTPVTSWEKFFCMCVANSYYASQKKFRPNACGYLQGCR